MKSFVSCDSVTHEGNTNTGFTPPEIITSLGKFDLDPCTQSFRPFDTAITHFCEDKGEDGLILPGFGRVGLNPPYGKQIEKWLTKLFEHGNGIALVFSRTETKGSQKILEQSDAVNFISGRISFIRYNGIKENNAGVGSMLLAFGKENIEVIKNVKGVYFKKIKGRKCYV